MRKVKKIFALAIMMVMIFTMNITVFATSDPGGGSATINIQGLTQGAIVKYEQIVEPDSTSTTGWKISDIAVGKIPSIEAYENASEVDRMAMVKDISPSKTGGAAITVTEAGLYLIKVTDPDGKYLYNPMIAYVGYDYTNPAKPVLKVDPNPIVAKKGPVKVEKTGDNEFVEIGDIVNYEITAQIPYIPEGTAEGTVLFSITDTITGGEYVLNENTGKLDIQVTYGTTTETKSVDVDSNSFTLNLDELTQNNTYANTDIKLAYSAEVTATVTENKAIPTYMGNAGEEFSFKAVTGDIEITKIGDDSAPLAGAKFVIIKDNKYAKFTNGILSGWSDTKTTETEIVTGDDGKVTVSGFDRDLDTYKVQETGAPTGYKLDETIYDAVWDTSIEKSVDVLQIAKAKITDTKLLQLPYTGGKGTAAFTGFGVLLMSVAAGLYFANKKNKSVK